MFGYSTNAKNQQVSVCTAEVLDRALRSSLVSRLCGEIEDALERCRRGELTRAEFEKEKSKLKLKPVKTDNDQLALICGPAVQPAACSPVSGRDPRHRCPVTTRVKRWTSEISWCFLPAEQLINFRLFICLPGNLIVQIQNSRSSIFIPEILVKQIDPGVDHRHQNTSSCESLISAL